MNIQWFPGHMTKTRRMLAENLKLIDVVIELLDSRIPGSSKNPEIDDILKVKPKIIALNKSDLADEKISNEWKRWYNQLGYTNVFINSKDGKGINELKSKLREIMREKIEREKQKGRLIRTIRTMVVGIPNVGKSSFINKIAGKASAITGDKPGVTRGKQWIRLNDEIELMDTPGILWPKFDDKQVGMNLAFTGAIKDDILDITELAAELLVKLKGICPEKLIKHYKIEHEDLMHNEQLLKLIGKKRGCVISGGEIDLQRISAIILDEFRGGKIGRISLERPSEQEMGERV